MANAKETRSVKNNIGLALFILILVAMFFIPTSETLTAAGRNSLGLLLATIVCMLTGGLPIGVLCMLVIPLMYICGCVETPAAALAGFQNQSAFFMLARFGLTCAVTRVPLSRRLMRGIITKAGRNVNTVLLAIMLCCGLLSSIVSNIAACSAFIPLVLDFLSIYENEDERKRTGRCMLIALPTASMIGGMITPAGGAVNVIAITYLENLASVNVTFLDWVAIFGPIAIVAFIAAYFIIRAVFKPAELTQDAIHHYLSKLEIPEKIGKDEIRVCVIIAAMLICWILGTWFSFFNIMVVAMVGVGIMMLPGIGVFGWKDFVKEVNWTAFFMLGTPLPEKPVMITFDDGYYNNYLNAYPLLQKYQMKAVISIIVGETDKYSELDENKENYSHITWDMINEMMESGLIEIQNHTYNLHKTGNPRRGAAQRKDETTEQYFAAVGADLQKAQDRIEEMTGWRPNTFTYPFGSYSRHSQELLEQLGFAASLGVEGKPCCLTRDPACLIRIPRYTRTSQKTAEELLCHFWD